MKKNFKPLVLLAATVLSVGFTSCVDNEVAPEVKSIYEKQAEWIGSQSELTLAQSRYQDAQTEYAKQQTENLKITAKLLDAQARLKVVEAEMAEATKQGEVDAKLKELEAKKAVAEADIVAAQAALVNNQTALATAKKDAEVAAFKLTFELLNGKAEVTNSLFTKYAAEQMHVVGLTNQLNNKNVELISANKELAVYTTYNRENQVEVAKDLVALKKEDLQKATSKFNVAKGKLEALKAKKGDSKELDAKIEEAKVNLAKLADDVKVAVADKQKLQRAADKAGMVVSKYNDAKSSYDRAMAELNDLKNDAAKAKKRADDAAKKLKAAKLEGKSLAELKDAKHEAEKASDKAEQAFDKVKKAYDDLNTNYEKAVREYADLKSQKNPGSDVNAAKKSLEDAQKAYDLAKQNFDKEPKGSSKTPGADKKLGDHSNDNKVTYYKLVWDGTNYIFTGEPMSAKDKQAFVDKYKADNNNNQPTIVDWNQIATAQSAKNGSLAGSYYDVEADDTTGKSYQEVLTDAEKALKAKKDEYSQALEDNKEFDTKLAEAKAEYDKQHKLLLEGKKSLDEAQAKLDEANENVKAYGKYVGAANVIANYNDNYGSKSQYNYKLVELGEKLTVAEKAFNEAEKNVSQESLNAYKKALAEVDNKQSEINTLNSKKSDLESLKRYYTALRDAKFKGSIDGLVQDAQEDFDSAKDMLTEATSALARAERHLKATEAGKSFDIDADKAKLNNRINTLKAEIANLEQQLTDAKAEAQRLFKLYEDSKKS